ncbi:MAG: hypothetical protein JJ902_03915 [Roseibium sp.]|nr:hypothetical protein [Roseibium sp.]
MMDRKDVHLDEITIPEIEITEGWIARDVASVEEAIDAYAYLMASIAEIEYELELNQLGVGRFSDPTWPARARRALKYKKAALNLVNNTRGRLEREQKRKLQENRDRAFLDHIKASLTDREFNALVSSFQWPQEHEDAA